MTIDNIRKIYFIGIGGIGVSAVAKIMLAYKKGVSGSDKEQSVITNELKKLGAKVFIGHQEKNLSKDTDLVVYTTAINKKTNPEFKKAQKLRIKTLSYPEFLGFLTEDKFTIAISGTHGKTTTTAIIGLILEEAGLDPTVVVGSKVKELQSNTRVGKSKYFVAEACEYRKAFLNLEPDIIVLTNIETDHLDYYKNIKNIKKAFLEYLKKLPTGGFVVANADDENIKDILKKLKVKKIWYGLNKNKKYLAKEISLKKTITRFEVIKLRKSLGLFKIKIPGIHNVYNSLAVISLAEELGIKTEIIKKILERFSGTWRRFEKRKNVTKEGVIVIDDYAHHPTEVKATLNAARIRYPQKKIWVVFQPHLYSRTKFLFKDFSTAFDLADEIIITDIYAARELNKGIISSKDLVREIRKHNLNAKYISSSRLKGKASFKKIEDYLKKNLKEGNVVLVIGAGDIFKLKI